MITITKKISISAGHRLLDHDGACKYLHGHNYDFFVTCTAEKLDEIGRVVDFKVIKDEVKGWLDVNWDHGMILNENDPIAQWFKYAVLDVPDYVDIHRSVKSALFGQKYFLLPNNPTAENLANYLKEVASGLLKKHGVGVSHVRCQETETSEATSW